MEISMNTPALLFPAISLIMLAYTNRFLALANVIRALHDRYKNHDGSTNPKIHAQITNLKFRIRLIKNMQIFGVLSFLFAIMSMYEIYVGNQAIAKYLFATSLILFVFSLCLSLWELFKSTESLKIELEDVE
ncbi:MAG: DUF2721 domain-containing protein [Flavobacteriales bacterium]